MSEVRSAPESRVLNQNDEQETRDLLVGRRIVSAERGEFEVSPDAYEKATGKLTLDDGTVIFITPNIGGCSCGAGDYELAHLATVDNAITDVRLATEEVLGEHEYDESQSYRIYVFVDAKEINVLQIDGDDGDGYYGTGYELFITTPKRTSHES